MFNRIVVSFFLFDFLLVDFEDKIRTYVIVDYVRIFLFLILNYSNYYKRKFSGQYSDQKQVVSLLVKVHNKQLS